MINSCENSAESLLPFVSIVVPCKNEESHISRVLDSLSNQHYPNERYEIVLVDNLSTDKTLELVGNYPNVKIVKTAGPISAVRNKGINESTGDVVAFIDADCIAPPEWIIKSVNHLLTNDRLGIVSSVLRLDDTQHSPWVERYWIENHRHAFPQEVKTVRTISSYCFCVRSLALNDSGLFNQKLETCEDQELGYRITAAGWVIVADKSIEVIHLGNAKNLSKFFLRQLWQGRSNIENVRGRKFDFAELGSLAAPTVFCLGLLSMFGLLLLQNYKIALIMSLLVFLVPIYIAFRKSPVKNAMDLLAFCTIWATYLIARGLGVFIKINRTSR